MATDAPTKPRKRTGSNLRKHPPRPFDGRFRAAKALKQAEINLAQPLGGLAVLTPAELMIVRSAASLSLRLEQVRTGLAKGDATTSDADHVRISNSLARTISEIDRLAVAKRKAAAGDPVDALQRHLAAKYGEAARAAETAA